MEKPENRIILQDAELDELFIKSSDVHLEQLSTHSYFLGIYNGEKVVVLNVQGNVQISWVENVEYISQVKAAECSCEKMWKGRTLNHLCKKEAGHRKRCKCECGSKRKS